MNVAKFLVKAVGCAAVGAGVVVSFVPIPFSSLIGMGLITSGAMMMGGQQLVKNYLSETAPSISTKWKVSGSLLVFGGLAASAAPGPLGLLGTAGICVGAGILTGFSIKDGISKIASTIRDSTARKEHERARDNEEKRRLLEKYRDNTQSHTSNRDPRNFASTQTAQNDHQPSDLVPNNPPQPNQIHFQEPTIDAIKQFLQNCRNNGNNVITVSSGTPESRAMLIQAAKEIGGFTINGLTPDEAKQLNTPDKEQTTSARSAQAQGPMPPSVNRPVTPVNTPAEIAKYRSASIEDLNSRAREAKYAERLSPGTVVRELENASYVRLQGKSDNTATNLVRVPTEMQSAPLKEGPVPRDYVTRDDPRTPRKQHTRVNSAGSARH